MTASRSPRHRSRLAAVIVMAVIALVAAIVAVPRPAAALDASVPVYRLYNEADGQHLITKDRNEFNVLCGRGWIDEGLAFSCPQEGQDVYRLYNPSNGDHLYTTAVAERDGLVRRGWQDEGTGFHASAEPTAYDVQRLYNPNMKANGGRGNHLWTPNQAEYDNVVKAGWKGEGHQWYATGPAAPKAHPDPVSQHGALSVRGATLVDKYGNPYQLRGMSTHGLSFTEEGVPFKDYVNKAAFKTLRDDWGANCVRLAMYTAEGGYCEGADQNWLKGLIRQGVNAATDLGMYVIVDWHVLRDQSPTVYEQQAREFFSQMSREFKDRVNVIYEICNEPNGGVDWWTIKGYAERIIPVIRANDPDAIVIVGTPTWSQDVDQAAANRLTGDVARNTMYALHFYANTHTQWLRDRMNAALDAGLPVFISEFGTTDASGNGGYNPWESQQWIDLANRRNVSWMNWSLCLKNESSAAIQPWCKKLSDWQTWELTESGNWVRNAMRAATGK